MLNDAIDDREFQVNCRRQRVIDSNIRREICRPRYVEAEQARHACAVFGSIPANANGEKVVDATDPSGVQLLTQYDLRQTAVMQKQQEFNEKLLRAVNEDRVLNRAFLELHGLKTEIGTLRGSE